MLLLCGLSPSSSERDSTSAELPKSDATADGVLEPDREADLGPELAESLDDLDGVWSARRSGVLAWKSASPDPRDGVPAPLLRNAGASAGASGAATPLLSRAVYSPLLRRLDVDGAPG